MSEVHIFQTYEVVGRAIQRVLGDKGHDAYAHDIDSANHFFENNFEQRDDGKPLIFVTSSMDSRGRFAPDQDFARKGQLGERFAEAASRLAVPTLTIVFSSAFGPKTREEIKNISSESHEAVCIDKGGFGPSDLDQVHDKIVEFSARYDV